MAFIFTDYKCHIVMNFSPPFSGRRFYVKRLDLIVSDCKYFELSEIRTIILIDGFKRNRRMYRKNINFAINCVHS